MRPNFGHRSGGSGGSKRSTAGVRLRAHIAPIAEQVEIEMEDTNEGGYMSCGVDGFDVYGVESITEKSECSTPNKTDGSRTPSSWSVVSTDRQLHLARQMRSTNSLAGSNTLLTELATADEPMGITPWCGRCPAQRPYAILPLKPDEVDPVNLARLQALEINRAMESMSRRGKASRPGTAGSQHAGHAGDARASAPDGNSPRRLTGGQSQMFNRLHAFKKRMKVPLDIPRFHKHPPPQIRDLDLPNIPAKSRFAPRPCESTVPVLQRLTHEEVSLLERWIVAHVKSQYIEVSAAFHAAAPKEEHKHAISLKLTTVISLLSKFGKNRATPEEVSFLMQKLHTLPVFCDMPLELLPEIAKEVEMCNFSRGIEIFKEMDEADGIYVLVQGEVELRSDIHHLIQDVLKEAPAAMLPEDIIKADSQTGRQFLLQKKGERFRSRTAMTTFTEEDISSLVSLIKIPSASLQKLSDHFRAQEAKERVDLVVNFFAPRMRMDVQKCKRNSDAFELRYFPKSHVIIQEGSELRLKTARLWLIIEGELRIVYPTVKVSRRGRRIFVPKRPAQTKGPGDLLGDEAIFGEPYLYSAVVVEPVKVLSLGILDYLNRFLHRSTPLQREVLNDASADTDSKHTEFTDAAARAVQKLDVYDIAKEIFTARRREAIKKFDAENVMAADWQRLMPREELARTAKTKPPERPVSRARAADVQDLKGIQDMQLCYPRELDLSPSLQRSALASLSSINADSVSGSAWWHPPLASLTGFQEVSLDRKIAHSAISSQRLEAAHRSHVAFGYHVEDATGTYPQVAPLLVAPPDSAVLLTCGAANLSRRAGRKTSRLSS